MQYYRDVLICIVKKIWWFLMRVFKCKLGVAPCPFPDVGGVSAGCTSATPAAANKICMHVEICCTEALKGCWCGKKLVCFFQILQNFCIPMSNFAFTHKIFVFTCKTSAFPYKTFVHLQRFLHSLANFINFYTNTFCSLHVLQWFRLCMFTMDRFIEIVLGM